MKRTAVAGLGGCAILLCGLIALEGLKFRAPALDPSGNGKTVVFFSAESHSDLGAGPVSQRLTAILARPLFSQNRTSPVATDAIPGAFQLPRLAGIVIGPSGKFAMFEPLSGEPLLIGEGQLLGPYMVGSIGAGGVKISGPSGTRTLHIAFASGSDAKFETPPAPPDTPFAGLASLPGLPDWLKNGPVEDLPNTATWSGPPALSRLPVAQSHPASTPLLQPTGAP